MSIDYETLKKLGETENDLKELLKKTIRDVFFDKDNNLHVSGYLSESMLRSAFDSAVDEVFDD